jgi:hypothetical protein
MPASFIQNGSSFLRIMDTQFKIDIQPRWWNTVPEITYGIDQYTINTVPVQIPLTLHLNLPLTVGPHKFWLTFNNKNYNDCQLEKDLDMAIEILSVTFEGMTLDRFRWAGKYFPDYPDHYPNKQPVIESATYLGWNGKWELPFTTPIFTWIHQLENLGWLYEP